MILNRFKDNIFNQNWIGLGLDVLVLVVGIFLGFQLDNWNEDRKNNYLEKGYLKRFESETLFNVNILKKRIKAIESRVSAQKNIIEILEGKSPNDLST